MGANTDKLFCTKYGCFKYVAVCDKCKHARRCDQYMQYRQPALFDTRLTGRAIGQ
ncbi:MAG: hypothetical protein SFH39_05230 [Candidatus Magnetobacterium sp. LHC-1]|uniref:Transposase n=1 Tax=Candidatus Magnetobacterium casense TaxID=1455061 RepID=A0ABS6RWA9_9BACT|nr:hypothetical protein [Candidatus Magnetobacterium casensis]MBF0608509.1 hypothetical protein [Nitrospirota bacterium]MBV6340630.1 hypothetical protein [Candidatus Magnetobacterium casensis]